jgi:vitamin-K-epoxide reductase (warfarin-sensitive)
VQFAVKKLVRVLVVAIAVLSFAGLAVSAVALQRHYAHTATSFCDLAETFNCDIVNRSEYSSIAGIPVAALGIGGYGLMLFLCTLRRKSLLTPPLLLLLASSGLAFALYLTYVEAYVLTTWCILCLVSLFIIFTITVLAFILKWQAGSAS